MQYLIYGMLWGQEPAVVAQEKATDTGLQKVPHEKDQRASEKAYQGW